MTQLPSTSSTALQNPGLACCVSGARLVQDPRLPFSPVASACAVVFHWKFECVCTSRRSGLSEKHSPASRLAPRSPLPSCIFPPGDAALRARLLLWCQCEKGRSSRPLLEDCPGNSPPCVKESHPVPVLDRRSYWRGRGPRKPRLSSLGASISFSLF